MKGSWTSHDVRDEVVDYVHYWSERTDIPMTHLVDWIALGRSKFYNWRTRYGCVNEHNAQVPRDFWLQPWERHAIVDFACEHPLDGYRQLTYMLLDADVVAVSPSSVYRVLREANRLTRWNTKPTKNASGPARRCRWRIRQRT